MDQPPSGRDRSKAPAKGAVTVSGSRGVHGSRILGSPMESSSGAKPRKLWPTTGSGATPASGVSSQAVRVEVRTVDSIPCSHPIRLHQTHSIPSVFYSLVALVLLPGSLWKVLTV